MKKNFQIYSIIMTTILLFSCANQTTEYGTLTLQLPSGDASRAAVNVDALSFNIEITNQESKESQKETGTAGSVHSIELPTGKYTIKLDAFTAENKEKPFYTGSVTDVEVTPGDTVKVALPLHEVQTAPVVFSVKAGTVKYGTKVELSSTTKNAKIYYTTDGSDPLTSSTKTEYKEAIVIKNDVTIKAYAKAENSDASTVTSEEYKLAATKPGIGVEMPEQIAKGDLVMEVEGESTVTLTVKSLTGKAIKSYSWLINGKPVTQNIDVENEYDPGNFIDIVLINENAITIYLSNLHYISSNYHLVNGEGNFNSLSCIAEYENGNIEDISYSFILLG